MIQRRFEPSSNEFWRNKPQKRHQPPTIMSHKLRIYDGATDIADFVSEFKIQAVYSGWEEAEQLAHLPLFLKGKAKRLYDTIATKTKIDDVLAELTKLCAKPKDFVLYQCYGHKLSPGSSLADYACELKDLLDEASPGMSVAQQLPFLRAQLCLQVPDHVRALIQFNSTMSWDELLSSLDKSFPAASSSLGMPTGAFSALIPPGTPIKSEPIDTNYGETRPHGSRGSGPRRSTRNEVECDYCHRIGHKWAECRREKSFFTREIAESAPQTKQRLD